MVMPYINHQLDETQLEQFLKHVKNCPACREELEIYYTVSVGLRQRTAETVSTTLRDLWRKAWRMPGFTAHRTARKVICYAANTLNVALF